MKVLTLSSSRCVITAEAVLWLRSGESSNRQLQNWGKLCSDASDKHSSEHSTSTCDQIQLIYTAGNIYGVTNPKRISFSTKTPQTSLGSHSWNTFRADRELSSHCEEKNRNYIKGMIYNSYICIKQRFLTNDSGSSNSLITGMAA